MDKRRPVIDSSSGRPVRLEWAVDAVVSDSSEAFAAMLQKLLNARSTDGFTITNMLHRSPDNGFVIMFQRATFLDTVPAADADQVTNGENDGLH